MCKIVNVPQNRILRFVFQNRQCESSTENVATEYFRDSLTLKCLACWSRRSIWKTVFIYHVNNTLRIESKNGSREKNRRDCFAFPAINRARGY